MQIGVRIRIKIFSGPVPNLFYSLQIPYLPENITLRAIVIFEVNGAISIYLIGTVMIPYIILFSDKKPILALLYYTTWR